MAANSGPTSRQQAFKAAARRFVRAELTIRKLMTAVRPLATCARNLRKLNGRSRPFRQPGSMGLISRTVFFEIFSSAVLGTVLFTFVLLLQRVSKMF